MSRLQRKREEAIDYQGKDRGFLGEASELREPSTFSLGLYHSPAVALFLPDFVPSEAGASDTWHCLVPFMELS